MSEWSVCIWVYRVWCMCGVCVAVRVCVVYCVCVYGCVYVVYCVSGVSGCV